MRNFEEGLVSANAIQIHYLRSSNPGANAKPVIFLHGVTDNGRCWLRLARALPEDYDLILMDGRAHGGSDAPVMGYSAEDRADDVAGFMKSLGIASAVLIGHSMGAETAMAVAAIYPKLTRAVVLEDPPWPGRFYGSTPEERAERASRWREDILVQKSLNRIVLIAQARENNPNWSEEDLETWADAKKEMHPNLVSMVAAPRRRWTDYLRQAECPLLVLTGDPERGAIVSPRTIEEAETIWRSSGSSGRSVHIGGAGHNIRRDQFDPYLEAVGAFLSEIYA